MSREVNFNRDSEGRITGYTERDTHDDDHHEGLFPGPRHWDDHDPVQDHYHLPHPAFYLVLGALLFLGGITCAGTGQGDPAASIFGGVFALLGIGSILFGIRLNSTE